MKTKASPLILRDIDYIMAIHFDSMVSKFSENKVRVDGTREETMLLYDVVVK